MKILVYLYMYQLALIHNPVNTKIREVCMQGGRIDSFIHEKGKVLR